MTKGIPNKQGYLIKSRGTFGNQISIGIAKSDEQWLQRKGKLLWFNDMGEVRKYIMKEWEWSQ